MVSALLALLFLSVFCSCGYISFCVLVFLCPHGYLSAHGCLIFSVYSWSGAIHSCSVKFFVLGGYFFVHDYALNNYSIFCGYALDNYSQSSTLVNPDSQSGSVRSGTDVKKDDESVVGSKNPKRNFVSAHMGKRTVAQRWCGNEARREILVPYHSMKLLFFSLPSWCSILFFSTYW